MQDLNKAVELMSAIDCTCLLLLLFISLLLFFRIQKLPYQMLLSQVKLIIAVSLLSDKILNFPSVSKSSPWVEIHLFTSTSLWLFLTRHWSFLFVYIKSSSLVMSINLCKILFSDWHNCPRIIAQVVEAIKIVYSPGKTSNISLVSWGSSNMMK